jgi:transcriptional regulator with XRE-family HTH domain
MATERMTNVEFGRRVGCSHSMASRIRSGNRLPGLDLMNRISEEFGISIAALVRARAAGPAAMADLLDRRTRKRAAAA